MSFLRTPALVIPVLLLSCVFAKPSDNCEKRALIISVRDNRGRPVLGLTPKNFRAEMHKRSLHVLSLEAGPVTRRVLVLLDVSGSMSESSEKWRLARLLAGDIAAYTSPHTQLGLLTFASEVRDTLNFDAGRTAFMEKIRSIETLKPDKGKLNLSALVDVLAKALEILSPAQPGDSIYMITDGADTYSHLKLRELRTRLLARNVRLFAFLLRDFQLQGLGPDADDFQALARDSGGLVVNHHAIRSATGSYIWDTSPRTQASVSLAAQIVYLQIENTYRLEIEVPTSPPNKKLTWQLDVIDERGHREKDVYVLYPRTLPSCTTSPVAH